MWDRYSNIVQPQKYDNLYIQIYSIDILVYRIYVYNKSRLQILNEKKSAYGDAVHHGAGRCGWTESVGTWS